MHITGDAATTAAPPPALALRAAVAQAALALRAAGRLAAFALHLAVGAAICAFVFPRLNAAARQARIRGWSVRALRLLGVALERRGALRPGPVLLLANHVSWLDILAILAVEQARFVSKADVRRWPLVGFLVTSAGTLFIERARPRDAVRVADGVSAALRAGETVALFPEGTTGDGPKVLPFHANLLQAAVASGVAVQPLAVRFADRRTAFSSAAVYAGRTTLVASLWAIARAEGLVAHLAVLPPLEAPHAERRALAVEVRRRIQAELDGASPEAAPLDARVLDAAGMRRRARP